MRSFDNVDFSILQISKSLFYEQGIRKTEMKDIAVKAGIGRSTLYRRFQSKDVISFYIAHDILRELGQETDKLADLPKPGKGSLTAYERLSKYAKAYVQVLISHPNEIRFLDEFDQIFTDEYPAEVEEASFSVLHKEHKDINHYNIFEEGLKDGSMSFSESPDYMGWLFTNIVMGTAQRVLPREKHYMEEQGYGREFIMSAVDLFLKSIKA